MTQAIPYDDGIHMLQEFRNDGDVENGDPAPMRKFDASGAVLGAK